MISLPLSPSLHPSSLSQVPTQAPSTAASAADWRDFATGTTSVGQGRPETLVHSLTDRKLSIRRFDNGVIEVDLKRPAIERLVLSGGGAKGVAFSGLVKALEAFEALNGIRTLSGSSAGAISAALLASGMDHAQFDRISDDTNLMSLLESPSKILRPVQHLSSAVGRGVGKIPGKAGTIGRLLFDLLPRLQSKAVPLETLIREKMLESITRLANASPDALSQASLARVDQMKANGYVTFADLATLSNDLPAIKQLNIIGTAMFDARPQMVVFNASLTPDMDVARAAHISGSLPVVFAQPSQQGLPFQAQSQRTFFQDGGIMLNTPVLDAYEPQFPLSAIAESEQLILKFQGSSGGKKNDHGSLVSVAMDQFIGAPYTAMHAHQTDRIKALADNTVTVRLKTKDADFSGALQGRVNFSIATQHKNQLQEALHIDAKQYLADHAQGATYRFDTLGGALLALDDRLFEAAAGILRDDPQAAPAIDFRQRAQQALHDLKQALASTLATTDQPLALTPPMRTAIQTLDHLADTEAKVDWLARQLNHGNDPACMMLLQAVKRLDSTATGAKSTVMTQAIKEMGVRDLITKSENFIREVIYPSLFRFHQPPSNIKLLKGAIVDLREARSAGDFNGVLQRIAERYVSRSPFSSARPEHSTTIDQARAWLIPGQ